MEMDEYTDLQAALPALDVRSGMRRAMGDRGIYLNLLHKFKCRFADFPSVIRRCFAEGDIEAAKIETHSLKGIAASLGAIPLHNATRELELQLQQSQTPAVLPQVELILTELLQQLEQLDLSPHKVNAQSVCTDEHPQGKPLDWHSALKELQAPLQKLQVNKVKIKFHHLRQCNWTESQLAKLHYLEQLVKEYKYKQAAEYIDGLL